MKNSGSQTLHGVIAWVRQHTMRIIINADTLPDWLSEGKMGVDQLYNETTYKEMEFALERLMKAPPNSRLFELREKLLGQQPIYFEPLDENLKVAALNEPQNEALRKVAAAHDLALIHGPPGTGKTTTLLHAIEQTLRTEKQVLVVAPSNTAVDLLTEKLVQRGIAVVRIGHPARVSEALLEHTLEGQMVQHPDYRRLKQIRKEAYQTRKEARRYRRVFDAQAREERRELLDQSRQLLDYADMTEKNLLNDVMSKAQVITATLVGSTQTEVRNLKFKTVFIDEAGQALAPATWIPILRAERVVLAGDHLQLPPTVKSFEAQQKGLGTSLFESCIENQPLAAQQLRVQYRMHQHIMQFSNQEFYENTLVAAPLVRDWLLGKKENENNLSTAVDFIDTAGCGFDETLNPASLSLNNPGEATLLLTYLEQLFERLEVERTADVWQLSVGIIAPYKEQVLLLRQRLADYPLLERYKESISIQTIDGFQGQERDIIAISWVRSNAEGDIGFLKDLRRTNVALTRARKKLVVIGDSATLANHPFYARWVEYAEQINAYRSAWEFIS